MSEFRGFTPPEVRQNAETEKLEKRENSPETIYNIQYGPPETTAKPETTKQTKVSGGPAHWLTSDGNLITPEKEELYRSPETLPEKEPGYGPKAAYRDDPGKTAGDDQIDDDDGE